MRQTIRHTIFKTHQKTLNLLIQTVMAATTLPSIYHPLMRLLVKFGDVCVRRNMISLPNSPMRYFAIFFAICPNLTNL